MNGSYIDRNIYDWEPPEPEFVNERERGWILCWCKILNNSAIWILRKFRLFNVIQKTWWPAWWPNLTNRGLSCYICRTKVADCEQSWTPRPNFLQHRNYGNNSLRKKTAPVSCPPKGYEQGKRDPVLPNTYPQDWRTHFDATSGQSDRVAESDGAPSRMADASEE